MHAYFVMYQVYFDWCDKQCYMCIDIISIWNYNYFSVLQCFIYNMISLLVVT